MGKKRSRKVQDKNLSLADQADDLLSSGKLDDFKVPDKIKVKKIEIPDIISVGSLVRYRAPGSDLENMAGWVLQNPNSPGGQTNSYVVTSSAMTRETGDGVTYILPRRINASQIAYVYPPEEVMPT